LGGEIISGEEKREELVENFSIGAMNIESALKYFRRVRNKAVITGGDRSDIQLAALETSTKCLILTGNLFPNEIIIGQAEEVGVPIILVKNDTLSTVERIETSLSRLRLRGERKVKRALELINKEVNFSLLYKKLGIR
jgi:BioD-like phosphotransacetylase family protein